MRISCVMACILVVLMASPTGAQTAFTPSERPGTPLNFDANRSNPATMYCPTSAELGKLLFFDTNLSYPTGRACASCHDPSAGFADPNRMVPVSVGAVGDLFGQRNAPTVAYCSHSPTFHYDAASGEFVGGQFWDGRAATVSDQARSPFINHLEMNNYSLINVVKKVMASSYAGLFKEVYGNDCFDDAEAAYGMIADAIAAYENSIEVNPFNSKFDQYLDGTVTLSRLETRGREIFEGKGGCGACHPGTPGPGGSPPLFTDYSYHNVGMARNPNNPYYRLPFRLNPDGDKWVDGGLGAVLGDPEQMGKMKVPTLRNVALTAPYGHNGLFKTLRGMVEFCANRNLGYHLEPEVPENVDITGFGNAGLRERDIDAVVAFLNTLSDGYEPSPWRDPRDPTMTSPAPAVESPSALSVSPNPFNPTTRIDYSVDASSAVRIAVYDVSGRLVRRLVDGDAPAGAHVATWDGRDSHGAAVASGIYFIRLETSNQTLVRKAVLTR